MTQMTWNQVRFYVYRLPYVTLHSCGYCGGFNTRGGKKSRCLKTAEYRFQKSYSKGPGRAPTGYYCLYHLIRTLEYSKYERRRARLALKKAGIVNGL